MQKKYTPTLSAVALAIIAVTSIKPLFAANIDITPAEGYLLPKVVYPGSTVRAFYTVQNKLNSAVTGYRLTGLPASVQQNTTGTLCPDPIHLTAGAHCLLQLDITGEAISDFAFCKGLSCSSAAVPLHITEVLTPLPMIAVGHNYNGGKEVPLLAQSSNNGATWAYPASILTELSAPSQEAYFNGSSCSEAVCVAVGLNLIAGEDGAPLLAKSSDGGVTWNYPESIMTPFMDGRNAAYFNSASCSGHHCVAVGYHETGGATEPLLAQSTDNGATWTYPPSIIEQFPDAFVYAFFNSASCSGKNCIAAGYNYNGNNVRPLLAHSSDSGVTWTYPPSIQTAYQDNALYAGFQSSSCSGNNCIAVGFNQGADYLTPLIAQSSDGGATWTYPPSINTNAPSILNYAYFTGSSCSENNCVAAGFNDSGTTLTPLLAQSSDGGVTWTYPASILTELPNGYTNALFSSASCSENNCIAAGEDNSNTQGTPLVAHSSDGGITWTYPTSILTAFPGPLYYSGFNSAICSGPYCLAAGRNDNGTYVAPLLAKSTDGGATWTYPPSIISAFPGPLENAGFNQASTRMVSLLPEALTPKEPLRWHGPQKNHHEDAQR